MPAPDDLDGVRCHDNYCPRSNECARWKQWLTGSRNRQSLREPGEECQVFVPDSVNLEELEVEARR